MKYFVYLLVLFTFFSCQHYKIDGENYTILEKVKLREGPFITYFKDKVFAKCIEKIYQEDSFAIRSQIFKTWMSYEAHGGMVFDEQDYKALESSIDSTASAFVTKHFSDWDYRSETDVLSTCLNFRNSKKLDSMAMSLYRKYKIRFKQKHQFDWLKNN